MGSLTMVFYEFAFHLEFMFRITLVRISLSAIIIDF